MTLSVSSDSVLVRHVADENDPRKVEPRPSAFGPMVTGNDVEHACLTLAARWIDTYLVELERRTGMELRAMPRPRSYRITSQFERMPEDQLPAIIVVSPGWDTAPPKAWGDGSYQVEWKVSLSALVSARSAPNGKTKALSYARLWVAALRWIVMQQRDTMREYGDREIIAAWTPVREHYDTIAADADRTICLGAIDTKVRVYGIGARNQGPVNPLLPPIDPNTPPDPNSPTWPVVDEVDVLIIKEPIDAPSRY